MAYYYAPWQLELRKGLTSSPVGARGVLRSARAARIPDPVTGTVLVGAYFLAYAPLLQPGPPAKTPTSFPIYNLGGFVV
jgi:hypothetical protein